MKRFMACVAALLVFLSVIPASSESLSGSRDLGGGAYTAWALGTLQFPWVDGTLLVSSKEDSVGSRVYGILNSASTLTIVGRDIRRCDLDLLSGQTVFAYGTFYMKGEGEATQCFIKELVIHLLPLDPRDPRSKGH